MHSRPDCDMISRGVSQIPSNRKQAETTQYLITSATCQLLQHVKASLEHISSLTLCEVGFHGVGPIPFV